MWTIIILTQREEEKINPRRRAWMKKHCKCTECGVVAIDLTGSLEENTNWAGQGWVERGGGTNCCKEKEGGVDR